MILIISSEKSADRNKWIDLCNEDSLCFFRNWDWNFKYYKTWSPSIHIHGSCVSHNSSQSVRPMSSNEILSERQAQ